MLRFIILIAPANHAGRNFTLINNAVAPFPSGDAPDPATNGRIMQFRVNLPLSGHDRTYNPASGTPLRGGNNQTPAIVRLANPTTGTLGTGVKPSIKVKYVPGVYIPGYGPPQRYDLQNAGGAIGGNPDIGPYLLGKTILPDANEVGWKDTLKMFPG